MGKRTLIAVLFAGIITMATSAEDQVEAVAASECVRDMKCNTQADFDAIKNCRVFTGTITVDGSAASELKMNGIEKVDGDMIVQGNSNMKSFSAPQLNMVTGELRFANHILLEKLNLPGLTQVKKLTMSVLPAVQSIKFPAGLAKAEDVRIEDTRSPSITGFNPESLESFTLSNNNYMKQFDFSSVKEVKGSVTVTANGNQLEFQAANLASFQNATFRNIAQLSLPALSRIGSDVSFHQNTFSSLNLDNVEMIGGTLTIVNNDRLTETSFKNLAKIGGAMSIGNNTVLNTIDGFPKLTEVDGTVDLAGNFENYRLQALQDVRGGMRIQTTSTRLMCGDLEKSLKGDNVVKGNTWSCFSGLQQNQMSPTVGQNSGGIGKGASTGNNVAATAVVPVYYSWTAFGILFLFTLGF